MNERRRTGGTDARDGARASGPEARLGISLDRLEERIKLLLARHAELVERYRTLTAARQRLDGDLDPVALDERLRTLEAENDRLVRHTAFLESRIRELLSRIRYVVEA
ncbi:MAG TPA: hypothetical protein VM737_11080 [Gemmatimonadota bacterium]|nr:hypothetical protein [Gemmatimonadota bacterium]